jgi:hypothetical protein
MSDRVKNEFHDHLDVCPHCQEHVFDLCPIGSMALRRSVDEPFSKRPSEVLIKGFAKAVRKYTISHDRSNKKGRNKNG